VEIPSFQPNISEFFELLPPEKTEKKEEEEEEDKSLNFAIQKRWREAHRL
jgi:hypothetical protein